MKQVNDIGGCSMKNKCISLFVLVLFLFGMFSEQFLPLGLSSYADYPREDESDEAVPSDQESVETEIPTVSELELNAKSVILIEATTQKVLYEYNADEALPPASVTKIMTLLLVMEAVDNGKIALTDMVTVSEEASSMGGSQIYLKVSENMSVEDLIKSVVVASANDAAYALAEYVAGSEEAFVEMMNTRAKELGMTNAHFENTNGLDDTTENHLLSARDIALMSAELLTHKKIFDYTTIWQDTIRNGAFTLTNTNRLIRFYQGANGLKTGSTSKAGFCISATALRDGMQLIAVVMGSQNRDSRNETAKKLLDWGFANYNYLHLDAATVTPLDVSYGRQETVKIAYDYFEWVASKEEGELSVVLQLPESVSAPVENGQAIGTVIYKLGDKEVGKGKIYAIESVEKNSYGSLFVKLVKKYFLI